MLNFDTYDLEYYYLKYLKAKEQKGNENIFQNVIYATKLNNFQF